ncbi:hypothetical protein [Methylorubrum aminovorans]|uniref:hypothetical protein n=1 Tax=Methylorubrum aminovorans TaxID=269069 RepID=UPI0024E18CC7|nr:hypothetical protein [Methylorubrum aminovorans]
MAAEVGLLEEYERHVVGDATVVSALYGRLARDGKKLLNGRAPCPCGLRRRGKPSCGGTVHVGTWSSNC